MGGAIAVLGSATFSSHEGDQVLRKLLGDGRCSLADSSAGHGGALYVGQDGSAEVAQCDITGNIATHSGGGVSVGSLAKLHMTNSTVASNQAGEHGGALYISGNATLTSIWITGNNATLNGGGLMCDACHYLTATALTAGTNQAGSSGGAVWIEPAASGSSTAVVLLTNTNLHNNVAAAGAGAYISSRLCGEASGPCFTLSGANIQSNNATWQGHDMGRGGGLYVDARHLIRLQGFYVQGNTALLGGGLYFNTTACPATASCIQLTNTGARGNMGQNTAAVSAGTELYVSKPELVGITCGSDSSMTLLGVLRDDVDRRSSNCSAEALGLKRELSSSSAHSMQIVGDFTGPVAIVASREPLGLELHVLDMYQQQLSSSNTEEADFHVSILNATGSETLLGATIAQGALNQPIIFSGLQLLADPGMYTLEFACRRDYLGLQPVRVDVVVRGCRTGERTGRQECFNCGSSDQFSLQLQSKNCSKCPDAGTCFSGLLVPLKGYWQSHPRSPQLHACLLDSACGHPKRSERLLSIQQRLQSLSPTNISNKDAAIYRHVQCTEQRGYTGNLCASCLPGYGRNGPFCSRCPTRLLSSWALAAVITCQAAIIAGQLIIYNLGIRQARNVSMRPQEAVPIDQESRHNTAPGAVVSHAPRSGAAIMNAVLSGPGVSKAATSDIACADAEFAEMISPATVPMTGSSSEADLRNTLVDKATGAFKILVEYVQLLGIIRSVKVPIPERVRNFLNAVDVTSASSGQVLYCSLWGSPANRMMATVVYVVLQPIVFILVVPLLYMAWRAVGQWRNRRAPSPRHLLHSSFIAMIFILLFFLPSVCRQLLLLFSFIKLDGVHLDLPPGSVLAAKGWYWLQLPDVEYFRGAHCVLVLAVGVPGLLLFAVAAPLGMFLLLHRDRSRLHQLDVRAWYGMLYYDYSQERYYWQSVVLAVQLMLICCAVLLSSVGTAVQLLSSLVVVVSYQYLTALAQPYKHPLLQHLSRSMLLGISLTLMLLLYLNAVQTTASMTAIIVLLLVLNTIIVSLLLGYITFVLVQAWPLLKRVQLHSLLGISSFRTRLSWGRQGSGPFGGAEDITAASATVNPTNARQLASPSEMVAEQGSFTEAPVPARHSQSQNAGHIHLHVYDDSAALPSSKAPPPVRAMPSANV